jgi:hypothetical protein
MSIRSSSRISLHVLATAGEVWLLGCGYFFGGGSGFGAWGAADGRDSSLEVGFRIGTKTLETPPV